MELADAVYDVVETFSRPAVFALANQMRSSALSIPGNIAEGNGRWSRPEYRQFLRQARGSAMELETQILFARRRKLIPESIEADLVQRTAQVARLINGLLKYLSKQPALRPPRSAL